jgi:hypothetical protein
VGARRYRPVALVKAVGGDCGLPPRRRKSDGCRLAAEGFTGLRIEAVQPRGIGDQLNGLPRACPVVVYGGATRAIRVRLVPVGWYKAATTDNAGSTANDSQRDRGRFFQAGHAAPTRRITSSVRSTRGALPVFRPVGFPESPPEPGVPVVPAPGSPQVPLRTEVMVHPVAGHGVGMAVPR